MPFVTQLECSNMATSAGAFFAGIGTTFAILALGFGGGLMMANSALKEPGGYQSRAASEAPVPVRVILPTSAEAAQPPQQPQQQASPPLDPPPTAPPAKAVHAPAEKQVEKTETRKAEAQERERKRRHAQRQARRLEEVRARQQRRQQPRELQDAPIMAFGGDSSPRPGREWFGN
jgi:type IV secretory pathway VirB10-like protein